MENQKEHVQHLLWKHQELSDNQEYNTAEFINVTFELIDTWGFEPDEFELFSFLPVPEGYIVYPILHDDNTTAWIVEYKKSPRGAYRTQQLAIEAIEKEEKIKELTEKFDKQIKKNSLDERYKDVEKQAKPKVKKDSPVGKYLDRLASRTKEMFAEAQQARMERNWKLGNVEYIDALMNH